MGNHSHVTYQIDVDDLVQRLVSHPLYAAIDSEDALRLFMRAHVFCVFDFQSLVTALQRALTCVDVPWLPSPDPEARRLINEIVLDEESDETADHRHLSHFELYLEAMSACGADRHPVERLIAQLRQGTPIADVLAAQDLPRGVAAFVNGTMTVARSPDIHRIAAAFTYGREEVIPDMFRHLVERLSAHDPHRWSPFLYYLKRHITTDAERHGPMSRALTARLCGEDEARWHDANAAAREALESRLTLWDAILTTLCA